MDINSFLKENLLLGTLCEGAIRINGGQHPMWKGFVNIGDSEVEAYVKKCKDTSVLLVEIISALIGKVFGLPIPRPIIIKIDPDHPEIPVAETTYIFGSEAQNCPNFARFLSDYKQCEEIILKYNDLHKIISFDELIANPDRNKNNILFDGDRYFFIDHEYCLYEKQNPKAEIMDTFRTGNISDIYKFHSGHNDIEVEKTLRKIRKFVSENINNNAETAFNILDQVPINNELYIRKVEFVKIFILERLTCLEALIKSSISKNSLDSHDQLQLIGNQ